MPHSAIDREALLAIVAEIDRHQHVQEADLENIQRRHVQGRRGFFSKADIIATFRAHADDGRWQNPEAEFLNKVRMNPVRTRSGVAPVTVLTKPFPCPGRCIFCPSDLRMPKSYLADEPGAQRAAMYEFDPYLQTFRRLTAFNLTGHSTAKVELLVLGGTWSSYPETYQRWFIKRCFDAMNDFGASNDRTDEVETAPVDYRSPGVEVIGGETEATYNELIEEHLRGHQAGELLNQFESATWSELEESQRQNESAACRGVGLVLETRPDHVDETEVRRLRRLGATKVQLGIQSLDDEVLRKNRRGHTVAVARKAMALLRGAAFKTLVHWMPNLYGATPESDIVDFARLFDDPAFRPDELKVYPCILVESADLMAHYRAGNFHPYTEEQLSTVLGHCLPAVPPYCRVTRVIRDFPSDDVVEGNKKTNFRQLLERKLLARGITCQDIRSREIGTESIEGRELHLDVIEYESDTARELFLQQVTDDDRIVGFLRLSLPRPCDAKHYIDELEGAALLREVHVYGTALDLGTKESKRPQHIGLGRRLIDEAAKCARDANYTNLAVISSVGTRNYYRKLGFTDGDLYQHRRLRT